LKIIADLRSFSHGSKFRDYIKVFILSPGFRAVMIFRLQSWAYEKKFLLLSYYFYKLNLRNYGFDALPGALIGPGLLVEHPVGIVIGAGVEIGKNCQLGPGVTLGAKDRSRPEDEPSFPHIGDGVFLGARSTIIGHVQIGNDSRIGAHGLVLKDVLAGSTVVGLHK